MDETLDFHRSRLTWSEEIQVGGLKVQASDIIRVFEPMVTPERAARLHEIVRHRTLSLVPVLENIYDRGNVSAVMRSGEAFGFLQMYLVDAPGARFKAANRVTKGAEKWLDVKPFSSPFAAVGDLRARGYQVWATDLATDDTIASIDWSRPTAIVLGNEKDGVSAEMRAAVDGCFRIPMQGFSQSFNISVAAALIFYHAHLQGSAPLTADQQRQVLANYYLRCFDNPEDILARKL